MLLPPVKKINVLVKNRVVFCAYLLWSVIPLSKGMCSGNDYERICKLIKELTTEQQQKVLQYIQQLQSDCQKKADLPEDTQALRKKAAPLCPYRADAELSRTRSDSCSITCSDAHAKVGDRGNTYLLFN